MNGAHVEYFRGLENPIGLKVSSNLDPSELVRILDILNPNKQVGKITLITRYGHKKISEYLPLHIEAVKKTDHTVVWICDPMVILSFFKDSMETRLLQKVVSRLEILNLFLKN